MPSAFRKIVDHAEARNNERRDGTDAVRGIKFEFYLLRIADSVTLRN